MDIKKKSGLFDEFSPISTQEWEEKIRQDLKGADYEKKLIWKTVEGLDIRPYYRSEDLTNIRHVKTLPNTYPFVRGNKVKDNNWTIRQDFDEINLVKANKQAVKALHNGAEAVGLNAQEINNLDDLKVILKDINPEQCGLHFLHSSNYPMLLGFLGEYLVQEGIDGLKVQGSFNFDPLAYYLLYGKFYQSQEDNFKEALELIASARVTLPAFRLININGQYFHNAGAHAVQELAFTLSQAVEYLAGLTDKGVSIDDITPRMQFTLAVGSNYFIEIAKLRAVKMLWAKIVEQFQPKGEGSMKMNLHVATSGWNKSVFDPYVNMLRTTTEVMAASIAGVDSMTVEPFDSSFKKADDFSYRIARNQQIIMKSESYFGNVADIAGGSYYIENITDSIAEAAWKLFVEIENNGGFVKAVESGFVKSEIESTCQKRDIDIAMRKQVFVGVNQYPNLQEKMLDKIQPTAKLSDLGVLRPYRGVQAFEALRLSVENHGRKGYKIPSVYLFTYGNLAMRKARATFATNFYGCAGYQIQEAPAIKDLQDGIEKALKYNAEIIVFCSSDDEYADMTVAAKTIKDKKPNTLIVVAGNPTSITKQLNEAGIGHYIHMRTNALETLQRFNDLLGIA